MISKEIYVSRDVIFFEDKFPFKDSEVTEKIQQRNRIISWEDDIESIVEVEHHNSAGTNELQELEHSADEATDHQEAYTDITEQRQNGRSRQLLKHLQDYQVELPPSLSTSLTESSSSSIVIYPLSNYVCYNKFSHSHSFFLAAISS